MARRFNSIALGAIIVLCILLIYVTNKISSPYPTADDYLQHPIKSYRTHRFYNNNHHQTSNEIKGFDNSRHMAKYSHYMHNGVEQRTHFSHRKFGGSGGGASGGAGFSNSEAATAETTNFVNTSVRIADVVEAQRMRIASKMKDFEYTEQMIGLSALTPETNGQPMQSVILSTWRSGSTFLGDILNAMPANYYHYEPLLPFGIVQIRSQPLADKAVESLRQLLKCNYTSLDDYLEFGQTHNYLFSHNMRLWYNCQQYPQFCFDQNFLNPYCRLFPFQSMKVVRLRAMLAEPLLTDADLNVRVILLIRDPRGIIQSRKHRDWCPSEPDCDNPAILCKDLVSDYRAAEVLTKKYPNKFRAIRYEDLSLDPFRMTQKILSFYGLPFDPDVEEFLNSHTRTDIGGVSSTFRDSKTAPFHWQRDLGYAEIQYIQSHCGEAMSLWGYKNADDEEELLKNAFNPLLRFPFDDTPAP